MPFSQPPPDVRYQSILHVLITPTLTYTHTSVVWHKRLSWSEPPSEWGMKHKDTVEGNSSLPQQTPCLPRSPLSLCIDQHTSGQTATAHNTANTHTPTADWPTHTKACHSIISIVMVNAHDTRHVEVGQLKLCWPGNDLKRGNYLEWIILCQVKYPRILQEKNLPYLNCVLQQN